MKLPEVNTGETLQDTGLGKDFRAKTSNAQETKTKVGKRGYQTKKLLHNKKNQEGEETS